MAERRIDTDGLPDPEESVELAASVRRRGRNLIEALDGHAPGAAERADAVGAYAFSAAAELGLGPEHADLIREVARLHEIGKVYVPGELLNKGAHLSSSEQERLDAHFESGYKLATGAGISDQLADWIVSARERFDGRGPDDLSGDEIPLPARIIRAAGACEAVLAEPATAPADSPASERRRKTSDELRGAAGRELDPAVVEALASILERAARAVDES